MINYKTSFKENRAYSLDHESLCEVSKMRIYRTKTGFKCIISGSLKAELEPWTEQGCLLSVKLEKRFPGITVCNDGSVHIEATSFSKCHPEDTFIEKKGQRIAESRCKMKIFTKSQKIIKYILEFKKREISRLEGAIDDYERLIKTESVHVQTVEDSL